MGRVLFSVTSLLMATFVFLLGCASPVEKEETVTEDKGVQEETQEAVSDRVPTSLKAAEDDILVSDDSEKIFRNSDGKIVCPVWQVQFESPELAAASLTLDGMTYYFSDQEAADLFEADPSKYLD